MEGGTARLMEMAEAMREELDTDFCSAKPRNPQAILIGLNRGEAVHQTLTQVLTQSLRNLHLHIVKHRFNFSTMPCCQYWREKQSRLEFRHSHCFRHFLA